MEDTPLSKSFVVESRFHDYSVEFQDDLPRTLEDLLQEDDIFIVDETVLRAHDDRLRGVFSEWPTIEVEATEKAKSFEEIGQTIEDLVSAGFRRDDRLIIVGGGVLQDLSAFIATVMYRGVGWVFIPTTLLSQADSCIGGKSSINFRGYKNLLGSFRPPNRILIDVEFLDTLPEVEITSGIGEILHFLVYSGEEDFAYLERHIDSVRTDRRQLRELIDRSLFIKKPVVEVDELDQGIRQLFNYGHSFGHAIEAVTDYGVPHGIAVSFGMDISNYLSVRRGMADEEFRDRVRNVAARLWEGFSIKDLDLDAFFAALRRDKKNIGDDVYVILTSGFGGTVKKQIDLDGKEEEFLREYFDSEAK